MDGRPVVLEDVVRGEMAEKELDAFIERRSRKKDPEEEHELWRESVRKHNARHREERLRERLRYHEAMLASHTATFVALQERHKVGLRLCRQQLGIPVDEGDAA